MDLANLPIGQKVVGEYPEVRNVATRINHTQVLQEQFRQSDGALILKLKLNIQTGEPRVEYYDPSFWTVTLNGKPFDPQTQTVPKLKTVNAEHTSRTLNLIR